MTRLLAILAVLLLLGCAGQPTLPPHGRWKVRTWDGEKRVTRWVYWCPHHGKLLIDGTIIPEPRKD